MGIGSIFGYWNSAISAPEPPKKKDPDEEWEISERPDSGWSP